MRTPSPTDNARRQPPERAILVWDAPVRVVHWLLVVSFVGAYLTSENEPWQRVHVTLGSTMGGLVAFRILWGLIGTRHARFNSFVRSPAQAIRYAHAMLQGHPDPYPGHSPVAAIAILVMLALTLAVAASGWAVEHNPADAGSQDLHALAAVMLLAAVGIHVIGVLLDSVLHDENLIRAMFSGRKWGASQYAIHRSRLGVAILIVTTVSAFWYLQWI